MPETKLSSEYRASWALVVGINDYQNVTPLSYAVNDAKLIANTLTQYCDFPAENVRLLLDGEATKSGILSTFDALLTDESKIGVDDRVLVFFAGHGLTRKGTHRTAGYLASVDSRLPEWHTFISIDELLSRTDFIPAKHAAFIIDACFGGLALVRGASSSSTKRIVADLLQHPVRQVMTAGMEDQVVADGWGPGGANSIFSGYTALGLQGSAAGPDGLITGMDLFTYVRRQVGTHQRSRQTPLGGNIEGTGDFIFCMPNQSMYRTAATSKTPALVMFLVDIGRLMGRQVGDVSALESLSKVLQSVW